MGYMEYDPKTGHDHYGQEVKDAFRAFYDSYLSYRKICNKYMIRENYFRIDAVQAAFNTLLRARKEETGISTYLDPKRHQEVTSYDQA